MKLMKHITIALVLCAIPAMAFAQTAGCEDCNHRLSVYQGAGGLIATAADDAEMVNYSATCGSTTRTGTMTPNDDGVVSMLLDGELACEAESATFLLGPIMDGGWFWAHIGDNSAVGNLVANDILDNESVDITDAGDSVTMTMGSGAVLLTHTSGRVGILPNILPEPPAAPATMCGAYRVSATVVSQVASGCMLGDGSTMVRILYAGDFGRQDHAVGSATVYRSTTAAGSVILDLWTTGGIISTDVNTTAAGFGYITLGPGLDVASAVLSVGGFGASVVGALGTGNDSPTPADADGTDQVTINFESADDSSYCTATVSEDAVLTVRLVSAQENTLPGPKNLGARGAPEYHGVATVTIKCPPPAANMGTNLVPDNPFPTPIG